MKKLSLSLASLLLSASFIFAQPAPKHHDKMQKHHSKDMAMQKLNLTEDQKVKMKSVNESFKTQMQALNSNENQTVKQLREKRASLMETHKKQVENILTADQKNQLATLKADAQKKRQEMATKHFDKMKRELNLTDQQVSQLKAGQEANKSKFEAIRKDESLDRTAKMQKLKSLREQQQNSLSKILTPEQKTKWEGMKKAHGKHFRKHHPKKMHTQPAV